MPTAIVKPQKRVLGDSTKAYTNTNITPAPNGPKRRKLDNKSSPIKFKLGQNGANGNLGSSQPKSQFEEALEKMSQDVSDLKKKNSEKDQQWDRPSLGPIDDQEENLCFQQIEAEEGTIHGGKTTVKLFGVTEVTVRLQHLARL